MAGREPPGPGPISASEGASFREQYLAMSKGHFGLVQHRFETYGDLYLDRTRAKPIHILRHPDHLHEVLVTKAQSFLKRRRDVDWFLGNGLLTSDGELWRRQRRLVQPGFQKQKIAAYSRVMVEHTERLVSRWEHGAVRDLGRDMMELTLSVVAKALLDHDTHGQADAVADAMNILQTTTVAEDRFPRWVPTPLHLAQRRAVKKVDEIIYPMIDAREPDASRDDLLSQLKAAADEQGTMSRQQLRDELITLFIAGHETTALVMTWCFVLLAEHPEEEAKLHEELARVLGGRAPSFEDLDALERTRLIAQEAMRLYPPLYVLPRVAKEKVEIGGFEIDEGAELELWVYFTQRDERWFPRASRFEPDRFQPDSGGVLHPHAYLPFGSGMRTCVGRHFAQVEQQLILASIAQRWRLRLPPGASVVAQPRVTLGTRDPAMMVVERRA